MFAEQLKERQVVAFAAPTTLNNTGLNTGNGIDMSRLRRARAFCNIGAITSSGSINFSLKASATSGGSFSPITNLTTNPTLTGIVTANQINALEIRADQMPPGKPWLRAECLETASQNVLCDLIIIGDECEYRPASTQPSIGAGTFTNDVVSTT